MQKSGMMAVGLTVLLAALAFFPHISAEPAAGEEASSVKFHFKGQSFTTQAPKPGNSTDESARCPGSNFGGRFLGYAVGTWSMRAAGDIDIVGAFSAALWAKSDQGAKNAGFGFNFYVNGNQVTQFNTPRQDINSPVKLTITDSLKTRVGAGSTIDIRLFWFSEPRYFVGPSSSGEFLYGSLDHDSYFQITLGSDPVKINITEPEQAGDAIRIGARINESFGMDPAILIYKLEIQGPATILPEHIGATSVSSGENGTTVSWLWFFKQSKAADGMYTLTVKVYYDVNGTAFQNATQISLSFTTEEATDLLKELTSGGLLIYLVLMIVIIAVAAGGGTFVILRRRKRRKLLAEAEEVELAQAA